MGMLIERVAQIGRLKDNFSIVPDSQVKERIEIIKQFLYKDAIKKFSLANQSDTSDLERIEAMSWLKSIGIPDGTVDIVWVSDKEGLTLEYDKFCECYDDLWFPGVDDVWITTNDMKWILELSHEEIFSLWVRKEFVSP